MLLFFNTSWEKNIRPKRSQPSHFVLLAFLYIYWKVNPPSNNFGKKKRCLHLFVYFFLSFFVLDFLLPMTPSEINFFFFYVCVFCVRIAEFYSHHSAIYYFSHTHTHTLSLSLLLYLNFHLLFYFAFFGSYCFPIRDRHASRINTSAADRT